MKKRDSIRIVFIALLILSIIFVLFFIARKNITGKVVQEEWCQGADINHDGKVDGSDLALLGGSWGRKDCSNANNWCGNVDMNRDGKVDGSELALLGGNWMKTGCSAAAAISGCGGADMNRDGKVDGGDLALLGGNWNKKNCSNINNWCQGADINRDGKVDGGDLALFGKYWMKTCPGNISVYSIKISRKIDAMGDGIFNVTLFLSVNKSIEINSFVITEYYPRGWEVISASHGGVFNTSTRLDSGVIEWLGYNDLSELKIEDTEISYAIRKTNSNTFFEGIWITTTPEGKGKINGEENI